VRESDFFLLEERGTARSGIARSKCVKLRTLSQRVSIGTRGFFRVSIDGMGDQKCYYRETRKLPSRLLNEEGLCH
jgi:hypothetical protein